MDPQRIPPLSPDEFTHEQRELVGPWSVLNFSRVLAHHPALYRVLVPFVEKVIRHTELPPWDREVLVVRTLARCGESYEASHHIEIARKCGISDAYMEAIRSGGAISDFDRHLVRAADELINEHRIGDPTWHALSQRYGRTQLMEVVGLVGCYTAMAMVTRTFGIPLETQADTSSQLENLRQYT